MIEEADFRRWIQERGRSRPARKNQAGVPKAPQHPNQTNHDQAIRKSVNAATLKAVLKASLPPAPVAMRRTAKQKRIIEAAVALAESVADANLQPSEMLDLSASLEEECEHLQRQAGSMGALADLFRTAAVETSEMVAGVVIEEE